MKCLETGMNDLAGAGDDVMLASTIALSPANTVYRMLQQG